MPKALSSMQAKVAVRTYDSFRTHARNVSGSVMRKFGGCCTLCISSRWNISLGQPSAMNESGEGNLQQRISKTAAVLPSFSQYRYPPNTATQSSRTRPATPPIDSTAIQSSILHHVSHILVLGVCIRRLNRGWNIYKIQSCRGAS
jgi:hypothetical protein